MLYALGPLTFEIAPVNAHEINRVTEASYIAKPVGAAGRRRSSTGGHHRVGETVPTKIRERSSLAMLDQMRQSGMRARSAEVFAVSNIKLSLLPTPEEPP